MGKAHDSGRLQSGGLPQPPVWGVAEIPSIPGYYALIPNRTEALPELELVSGMIEAEYRDKGAALPVDTTKIVHA